MEAVIYKLKTGCQWDLLPDGYPPQSRVWDRFTVWRKARVFDKLFRAIRTRRHVPKAIELFHMDATVKVVKRGILRQSSGQVQEH
jgi:transposase